MNTQQIISSAIDGAMDQPVNGVKRVALVGAGLVLVSKGLNRRGIGGTCSALAGAVMCIQGITGKSPLAALLSYESKKRRADAPSFAHMKRAATQEPSDDVEEASMESFPASDPPSSHRSESARF
jgi:uncharacterized membrane protein